MARYLSTFKKFFECMQAEKLRSTNPPYTGDRLTAFKSTWNHCKDRLTGEKPQSIKKNKR